MEALAAANENARVSARILANTPSRRAASCLASALLGGALIVATAATAQQAPRAETSAQGNSAIAYGDGWATVVPVPAGWDSDCCQRAPERNVNLLVYPHGWDGKGDDRVMTLTVWTNGRPTLDADWQADASDYQAHFPDAVAQPFSVAVRERRCRSAVYTAKDGMRDYVAFCDAGSGLNFRFGWSMTLYGEHADRAPLEAAFRSVVAHTLPMSATIERRAE